MLHTRKRKQHPDGISTTDHDTETVQTLYLPKEIWATVFMLLRYNLFNVLDLKHVSRMWRNSINESVNHVVLEHRNVHYFKKVFETMPNIRNIQLESVDDALAVPESTRKILKGLKITCSVEEAKTPSKELISSLESLEHFALVNADVCNWLAIPTGCFTNMRSLRIATTYISGILNLEALTNLHTLELPCNSFHEMPGGRTLLLPSLTSLDLSLNSLKKFPMDILALTALRRLLLRETSISIIPEELGVLAELRFLDLRENSITKTPLGLGLLTNLRVLKLSGNTIQAIDRDSLPASLEKLLIGYNKLCSVDFFSEKYSNLKTLEAGAQIKDFIGSISSISSLTSLTKLSLAKMRLTALPRWVNSLTKLTSLNVSGNRLKHIPGEAAVLLPSLRKLDVRKNSTSPCSTIQIRQLGSKSGQCKFLYSTD